MATAAIQLRPPSTTASSLLRPPSSSATRSTSTAPLAPPVSASRPGQPPKTLRRPQRVLRPGQASANEAATASLASSSRTSTSAATGPGTTTPRARRVTPAASSSSSASSIRPPRSTTNNDDDAEFKKPLSPSTARPHSRIVSTASSTTSSNRTLGRSLSRSTSGTVPTPALDTARPASRTLGAPRTETTPRKPAATASLGVGRPPALSSSSSLSAAPDADTPRRTTPRRRSSTASSTAASARSVSGASSSARSLSASQRTPLRSSMRQGAGPPPSSAAPGATARRTAGALASSAARGPAAAGPRALGASATTATATASAIPVPGGRTLRRPELGIGAAGGGLRSSAASALRRPTPRTGSSGLEAGTAGAASALGRSSRPSSRLGQPATSGGPAPPHIALSPPPGPDTPLLADPPTVQQQLDPHAYATPRKLPLAPPSADDAFATPVAHSTAAPDASPALFAHSAFLSPLPPPPATPSHPHTLSSSTSSSAAAAGTATATPKHRALLGPTRRARPRESLSLEELLRQGLLSGSASSSGAIGAEAGVAGAGGRGGVGAAADEWELLLDEGSSRLMREEMLGGPGTDDAAAGEGAAGPRTPWRGRVVSLGMSVRRSGAGPAAGAGAGVGSPGSPASERSLMLSPPSASAAQRNLSPAHAHSGEDRVLVLRQSTTEASSLRRQLAALQAELDLLRRAPHRAAPPSSSSAVGPSSRPGSDRPTAASAAADERLAALAKELDAARAREAEARLDWDAERREMELEMAELAAAASAPLVPSAPPAVEQDIAGSQVGLLELELELAAERRRAAQAAAQREWAAVGAAARRERLDVQGELEALRVLKGGLELWA